MLDRFYFSYRFSHLMNLLQRAPILITLFRYSIYGLIPFYFFVFNVMPLEVLIWSKNFLLTNLIGENVGARGTEFATPRLCLFSIRFILD